MTAYLVCDEPSASTTREPLTGRSQLAPLGCRNRPIGANGTLCAAAEFARTRPWHTRITQIQIGSAQASSASTPRYRPSAKPPCQPVSQSPGLRQPGSQLGRSRSSRSRSGRSRSGGVGQAAKRSRSQEVRKSGSQEVRKSGSQEVRKSGSQEVRKSGSQEVRKFARHQSITATFDSASFQHRSGTTLRSETHQSPERLHRVRQHPLRCHGEQLSGRQLKPQPMLQAPVNM
jgi:hypothetical protein